MPTLTPTIRLKVPLILLDLRKVSGSAAWSYSTDFLWPPTSLRCSCATTPRHPQVAPIRAPPTTYTIPGNWQYARAGFDTLFQVCVMNGLHLPHIC